MATSGIGFRWLDILEKEFDKACVELNTSLSELQGDEPDVVFAGRQKVATLSSCFAQLTHKALTIFQNNAKLEAELVDMRAELVQARAESNSGQDQDLDASDEAGMMYEAALARAEAAQFARENAKLRECVLGLHSELFGARLATKYLDKELAGRIQQLQLLGRDMKDEVRDSLWAQVEAEILLQRHKTLVRVCRGAAAAAAGEGTGEAGELPPPPPPRLRHKPRTVRITREPHHGLGISVTGGREHGVPILISELELGGPAARTQQLHVGDAILAIDNKDLTQVCHAEAVSALQGVRGDCSLRVLYAGSDAETPPHQHNNHRFPLYWSESEVEADGGGATPTAPRTPPPPPPPPHHAHAHRPPSPAQVEAITSQLASLSYSGDNAAIVGMDDDVIQISAPRNYRPLPVSSPSNVSQDTPVHRRTKRRKPHDWRTKGTYRPVADSQSSDDERPNGNPEPDLLSTTEPKEKKEKERREEREQKEERDRKEEILNVMTQRDVQQPKTRAKINLPSQRNGHERKSKPFRIGTAKRISEPTQLPNGNMNGEKEMLKYPVHLVTGDGDPDFGTPV